jgi:actin-related protein
VKAKAQRSTDDVNVITRHVVITGGGTKQPGFVEQIESLLAKVPELCTTKVMASPLADRDLDIVKGGCKLVTSPFWPRHKEAD